MRKTRQDFHFATLRKPGETINGDRKHWSLVLNYWYLIIDSIDCFPIITFNYWHWYDWLVLNYHFQLLMLLIGSLLAISIIDMIDCFPMITFNYWCYWCIEMEKSLLHYPSREVKYYSPIIVIRLQKNIKHLVPNISPDFFDWFKNDMVSKDNFMFWILSNQPSLALKSVKPVRSSTISFAFFLIWLPTIAIPLLLWAIMHVSSSTVVVPL